MQKVKLVDEFAAISEHWSPVVVAELNGQQVKLVKLEGEFQWHSHSKEDELFLVISGDLRIDLPDESVSLSAGEFIVVDLPRFRGRLMAFGSAGNGRSPFVLDRGRVV